MELSQTEKMVFALLRLGLGMEQVEQASPLFAKATAEDWEACHRLAVEQGVMAIAWDGVCTLPANCQPPKALKLNWALAVERYEEKYRRYCRTLHELVAYYAAHGIAVVQLKGVGLSSLYPIPCHREGGDLDLFTYSADTARLSDKEANHLADRLMEEQGIQVDYEHTEKHSMFYYKGIPVENHKTFLNAELYRVAAETDRLLQRLLQPQVVRLDGQYDIQVPSPAFNAVFLPFHAAQHYARGLSLHQLCDWACLLQRYGLHIPEEVTDERFRRFIFALTQICNDYLGTQIPLAERTAFAEEVMSEILHPPFAKRVPATSKLGILRYKVRRMLHTYRCCNSVLRISLAAWIAQSVRTHLRFPETVFDRGQE